MIQHYNRKSFYFGIPGFILQIAGNFMTHLGGYSLQEATCAIMLLVGSVLLLTGFAYYAKAKGRHPAWCLLAFLSIIGLLFLALLKDKSIQTPTEVSLESLPNPNS